MLKVQEAWLVFMTFGPQTRNLIFFSIFIFLHSLFIDLWVGGYININRFLLLSMLCNLFPWNGKGPGSAQRSRSTST